MSSPVASYFALSAQAPAALKSLRQSVPSKVSALQSLFAVPTATELQAWWELCRLQNGMGCATVFLPLAWSIAMVYHAQTNLTGLGPSHRTKKRALPRGHLHRARLAFFAMQVVVGVALAYKVLSPDALAISMTVWPLYVLYPTCKRWMSFAPVPLGLMFNIGIFMGWADLTKDGRVAFDALMPIYIGALLWTITYETVYQHQDKVDDMKIGMKSLAIFCGEYTIPVCTATTLGFGALLTYGGIANGQGVAYFAAVALATAILLKNLMITDIDEPKQCMNFFLLTPTVGNIILGGLVVDAVTHRIMEGIPLLL
ncbi:UbiA prenyltransferase family-domain-containing protein [Mucidula mucida]|nr:UbiA prenyltransferase family-domain-containing protein [Mucidula mucida]